MSQELQKDCKVELSYSIFIEDLPQDLITYLKEKNIRFQVWQNRHILDDEEIPEEYPLIPVDIEIFKKLQKISEITGISLKDMANEELTHLITDHIKDEPLIFLDTHLGIENIENPLNLIEQMKDLAGISDKFMTWLKDIDPIEYVNNWYHVF